LAQVWWGLQQERINRLHARPMGLFTFDVWGNNEFGQLGIGLMDLQKSPNQVVTYIDSTNPRSPTTAFNKVAAVEAGASHSLFLKNGVVRLFLVDVTQKGSISYIITPSIDTFSGAPYDPPSQHRNC